MDQVYWIGSREEDKEDARKIVYRYGRFVYSGQIIPEPILGLEYLPCVLQGIQAVQGHIPYIAEISDLPTEDENRVILYGVERMLDVVNLELDRQTGKLAELIQEGNTWLDGEENPVFFEFEANPGFDCSSAEVVFAKSYRNEVLISTIWYSKTNCFYVYLTSSSGEEQALVDTMFPYIFGNCRGVTVTEYPSSRFDKNSESDYIKGRTVGLTYLDAPATPGATKGSGPTADPFFASLEASSLFCRLSAWESHKDIPAEFASKGAGNGEGDSLDALAAKAQEDGGSEEFVDLSGGEGYTQVYLIMSPSARMPPITNSEGEEYLFPREALFRFGSWVYSGQIAFPVPSLVLGDVPYVLPALQKQQGFLDYIAEIEAFPTSHAMTPAIAQFMDAVGILKREMESCQSELAELADSAVNGWIDQEWSASFFELTFQENSIPGNLPSLDGHVAPSGLRGAEMIACKVYLFSGSGVILHCVWMGSSLYCVLSDNIDNLPLLDVAFPDVTARNRVVQVRSYEEKTARKLVAEYPNAPLPKALRVWEGRRKGAVGVGYGSAAAIEQGKDEIQRLRESMQAKRDRKTLFVESKESDEVEHKTVEAVRDVELKSVDVTPTSNVFAAGSSSTEVTDVEGKRGESKDDDFIPLITKQVNVKSAEKVEFLPSQLYYSGGARPRHHLAPLTTTHMSVLKQTETKNRLAMPTKEENTKAPWDASGKPIAKSS